MLYQKQTAMTTIADNKQNPSAWHSNLPL